MKHLILFSLKRKFFNKSFLVYIGIIFLVCCGGVYSDKIIKTFFSGLVEPTKIKVDFKDDFNFCELASLNFVCDNNSKLVIQQKANGYIVKMPASAHPNLEPVLKQVLLNYEQEKRLLTLPSELAKQWIDMSKVNVDFSWDSSEYQNNNQDYLFIVITSIYFMMLGFASGLANEIAAEKLGNILEIIGTSISLKVHYYAKIIIGWLSIGISISAGFMVLLFILFSRMLIDNGSGLIEMVKKFGFKVDFDNFSQLFDLVLSNQRWLALLFSLFFLWIGILFVQLILVIISSRLKTIEETNALQSPVYIVLLILYYVSMFMNYPQSMISGFGYYSSFVPVLSMIFMPSRLLVYHVSMFELILAILIAVCSLFLFIWWGREVYVRNVLNIGKVKRKKLV